jgi:hypothetical protein
MIETPESYLDFKVNHSNLVFECSRVLHRFSTEPVSIFETNFGIEPDVEVFARDSVFRAAQLTSDTELLLSEDRLLGAAASSRSALETSAMLSLFFGKFKVAVSSGRKVELRRLISAFVLSSHEFSEDFAIKAPNVMDAVRFVDKEQKGIFSAYCVLCEFVHPNWSGRSFSLLPNRNDRAELNSRRLVVAATIAATATVSVIEHYTDFAGYIKGNRKNLQNTLLFAR